MNIPDNIIKSRIKNIYFIWGRGKTTIANRFKEKYGYYIYSTDHSRDFHSKTAEPRYQPYMCRDFEKECGVKSFWELPCSVIAEREKHILAELTPIIIADLIELSAKHKIIICEGDIDYETIISLDAHAVYLCHCGTKFDWFNRPDHRFMLDSILNRTDISEAEKERIIANAYEAVSSNESVVPNWVIENNVKCIKWYDNTDIFQTTADVEKYFGFNS